VKTARGIILRRLTAATALLLLAWVAISIDARAALAALVRLQAGDLLVLLLANVAMLALFNARWWLLLNALGSRVPFARLMGYRLTAFGISYFTPGPHFGGEPYQVYALVRRHAVPPADAIASVTLDKLLEMLINFAMLAAGVVLLLARNDYLAPWREGQILVLALLPVIAPTVLLAALISGRRPLARLVGARASRLPAWAGALLRAEEQSVHLLQHEPRALWWAGAISLLSWVGVIVEFHLLTYLLEFPLSLFEVLTALVAARLAILLPMPAGLGALEAGQALAASSLGLDPSLGVAIALVIRGRDVLLGAAGLLLGGVQSHRWVRKSPCATTSADGAFVIPYTSDRDPARTL
jgi:uncharacterized protein (TIRG00374 family)